MKVDYYYICIWVQHYELCITGQPLGRNQHVERHWFQVCRQLSAQNKFSAFFKPMFLSSHSSSSFKLPRTSLATLFRIFWRMAHVVRPDHRTELTGVLTRRSCLTPVPTWNLDNRKRIPGFTRRGLTSHQAGWPVLFALVAWRVSAS